MVERKEIYCAQLLRHPHRADLFRRHRPLSPVVIKCEYYFSERIWPLFLAGGLAFCAASLFAEHLLLSAVLGVVGFTLLWSIHKLKQQAKRVEKGWFPKNPKRAPKN